MKHFFIKTLFLSTIVVAVFFATAQLLFATSHVSLFMQNWIKFNANDPPQQLPTITVTDVSGGNITPDKGITIILPKYTPMLWDKSVTQLTVNGASVAVIYDKTLKNLIIPVSKTLSAGEAVTITGQKVRIYDKGYTYENLGLDVSGDGVSDATGINGVQIDETVTRTDLLPPFQITGLTIKQGTTTVTLSWENPPDPDFNGLFIERTLTRGTVSSPTTITIDRLTTTYTDEGLQIGDSIQYSFKTKDTTSNLSEAVTVSATIQPEEAPISQGTSTPSTPAEEPVQQEEEPEPPVAKSVLENVTEEDINAALLRYRDLSRENEHLKEIVYILKLVDSLNPLQKGKTMKLSPAKKLTNFEFAAVSGKVFSVKRTRGSYFIAFKKSGYFSAKKKSSGFIRRRDAFRILLKLKGIEARDQSIADPAKLKGYATKEETAVWIVRLLDL